MPVLIIISLIAVVTPPAVMVNVGVATMTVPMTIDVLGIVGVMVSLLVMS